MGYLINWLTLLKPVSLLFSGGCTHHGQICSSQNMY